MKKMNKKGFTLVEIMIVVAIIGLLAAIGIPSFSKARASSQAKSCINNMRIIEAAMENLALETGLVATDTVTAAQVGAYVKGEMPTCPVGSTAYVIPAVGTAVVCPKILVATDHTL